MESYESLLYEAYRTLEREGQTFPDAYFTEMCAINIVLRQLVMRTSQLEQEVKGTLIELLYSGGMTPEGILGRGDKLYEVGEELKQLKAISCKAATESRDAALKRPKEFND